MLDKGMIFASDSRTNAGSAGGRTPPESCSYVKRRPDHRLGGIAVRVLEVLRRSALGG